MLSPRVLIVDDSKIVRGVLSKQLTEQGFEITLAETGSEGFALGRTGRFELIIAAIEPPRIDGFELCERLRRGEVRPVRRGVEQVDEQGVRHVAAQPG